MSKQTLTDFLNFRDEVKTKSVLAVFDGEIIEMFVNRQSLPKEQPKSEEIADKLQSAVNLLEGDHVILNMHRLGLLGSTDITSAIEIIKSAKHNLSIPSIREEKEQPSAEVNEIADKLIGNLYFSNAITVEKDGKMNLDAKKARAIVIPYLEALSNHNTQQKE